MDVLSLMKLDHSKLLHSCVQLVDAELEMSAETFCEFKATTVSFLRVEEELLVPEFSEVLQKSARLVGRYEALLRAVQSHIERAFQASSTEIIHRTEIMELICSLRKYVAWQGEELMPRIRASIPTQEREDLGRVYIDLTSESMASAS